MLCTNCIKLAFTNVNKNCVRCQGQVIINISVLCEFCSTTNKQCSVCLKKIISVEQRNSKKGCGCGGKK